MTAMVCAAVVGFAFFVGLVTERDLLTVAVVLLVAAHVRAARLEAEVAEQYKADEGALVAQAGAGG